MNVVKSLFDMRKVREGKHFTVEVPGLFTMRKPWFMRI